METGAFAGMSSLETLQINWPINNSNQQRRPTLPPLDHIPTLELLTITTRGWIFTPQASHLRDLPNLQTLVIRGDDYSETAPRRFRLNANLFESNPALEVVEIRLETNNIQIAIAKDTLSLLHGLKGFSLSPYSDSEISLSPNSPLMKDILNGRQSPQRLHPDSARSDLAVTVADRQPRSGKQRYSRSCCIVRRGSRSPSPGRCSGVDPRG